MASLTSVYLTLLVQALALSASSANITQQANSVAANCLPYTVKSGDTCLSIAWANNVSYAQLITWNPNINSACSNLAALDGDTICTSNPNGSNYTLPAGSTSAAVTGPTTAAPIPSPTLSGSNSNCGEWYKVESGQDCGTIETKFAISLDDFLFLNPEVWGNCTNLQANVYYCVEAVGSVSTYPGYGGATATATQPFVPTNCTSLPWYDLLANYKSTYPVIPLANYTRTDCYQYLVIPSRNYTINKAANCWGSASSWGISPADFVLWNPSLNQNYSGSSVVPVTATASSDYTYPCTLSSSVSYCILLSSPTPAPVVNVTAPSPRASGEASNCTNWGYVNTFNDCQDLLALYDLTIAEFYLMNPSVGQDCAGLAVGTYYCVSWFPNGENPDDWGYLYNNNSVPTLTATATATATSTGGGGGTSTPSPVQTGITSSCNKFYFVQQGDTCYDIAQNNSVTLDNFYSWNPAVKECADLESGYYVCVGVQAGATGSATATATATTATTATQPIITTPTPYQSGMVSDCNKFYDVESGDGCWAIASSYGIDVSNFYSWNPGVSSCSALWPSYYVCVGTGSAGAAKRTAIASVTAVPTTISSGV